jgi:uncharacterized membrane protein YgcG
MRNITFVAIITFSALTLFIMGPAAFAGNKGVMIHGLGDGVGNRVSSVVDDAELLVSANQTRTKDRKKDGFCLLPMTDTGPDSMIMAKGGNGKGGKRSGKGSGSGPGSGNGPGNGKGNNGVGPKDGSGNGNKSGDCINS